MSTQYQIQLQYIKTNSPCIAGTYVSYSRAEAMLRMIRLLAKSEILEAKIVPIHYRNKKEKRKWFLNMLKKREAEKERNSGGDYYDFSDYEEWR